MGGVHNDNQFLSPLKPSDIEEIHFVGSVISLFMEAELGGGVREEHRSSHQICSVSKVFLKISKNSLENTVARISFLIKPQVCTLLKRDPNTGVFL